jgi:hypothetical protein
MDAHVQDASRKVPVVDDGDQLLVEVASINPAPVPPVARAENVHPLTLDFLTWLAARPRSYDETMDAWRTSCPRLSIWEDALADGLVRVVRDCNKADCQDAVVLTPAGQSLLQCRAQR